MDEGAGGHVVGAIVIACTLANLALDLQPPGEPWTPARLLAEKLLPGDLVPIYSRLARGAIAGIGAVFVFRLAQLTIADRRDLEMVYFVIFVMAICLDFGRVGWQVQGVIDQDRWWYTSHRTRRRPPWICRLKW